MQNAKNYVLTTKVPTKLQITTKYSTQYDDGVGKHSILCIQDVEVKSNSLNKYKMSINNTRESIVSLHVVSTNLSNLLNSNLLGKRFIESRKITFRTSTHVSFG